MEATADAATFAVEPTAANKLLDTIITSCGLKNDAALSRALEVAPPVISKIRHGRISFGACMLIRVHELTDWPVRQIKQQLGLSSLNKR